MALQHWTPYRVIHIATNLELHCCLLQSFLLLVYCKRRVGFIIQFMTWPCHLFTSNAFLLIVKESFHIWAILVITNKINSCHICISLQLANFYLWYLPKEITCCLPVSYTYPIYQLASTISNAPKAYVMAKRLDVNKGRNIFLQVAECWYFWSQMHNKKSSKYFKMRVGINTLKMHFWQSQDI